MKFFSKISFFLLFTSCNMLSNTNNMLEKTIEVQEKAEEFFLDFFKDISNIFRKNSNDPISIFGKLETLFLKRYLNNRTEEDVINKLFHLMNFVSELTEKPFTNGESK